ncbi:hypothetical protein FJR11_19330 [Anabaena sp. UHCC 0187]|uniref:hypothetical protein n=1 Tax=Anabaena sp. UHCC 0187 TaxID=2590018 RepID=UPI0014482B07|nr:hypothetical protein [Anabaena sp. UHCC 0187]MTJ14689.1 hypothetical protein [Anabaena sp. UHCC 0187]
MKEKLEIRVPFDYPPLLMEALAEVRATSLCNMFNYACVILTFQDIGYGLQADWLEQNIDRYVEILADFSQWLKANPRPFRESLAQRVARETGLELIAE